MSNIREGKCGCVVLFLGVNTTIYDSSAVYAPIAFRIISSRLVPPIKIDKRYQYLDNWLSFEIGHSEPVRY